MKRNILYVALAVLILMNVRLMFRLNNLESILDNRIQQNDITTSQLRNEINNIYSNVQEQLKQQASVLESHDVTFGHMDSNDFTVPVNLELTPKQLTDDMAVFMLINDKQIKMERKGTVFTAAADARIFDGIQLKVVLEQAGVQRIETIAEYNDIMHKYLLDISGGFSGKSTYGSHQYQLNGKIDLSISCPPANKIQSIDIVKEVNGAAVDMQRQEISNAMFIPYNEKLIIKDGDVFLLYALVKDSYGLSYKHVLMSFDPKLEKEAMPEYPLTIRRTVEIRDSKGNILFTPVLGVLK